MIRKTVRLTRNPGVLGLKDHTALSSEDVKEESMSLSVKAADVVITQQIIKYTSQDRRVWLTHQCFVSLASVSSFHCT